MTKIYLVESTSGSYEDYSERIEKAFFNKEDAENFKNQYNLKLREEEKLLEKCENCFIYAMDIDRGIRKNCKPFSEESKLSIIQKANDRCRYADVKFYDDCNSLGCKNKLSQFILDKHDARIKEIDVY